MSETINIKSDKSVCIAHGQAVVEARQPINGECKLLSATASAVAVPSEVFTGEARYAGKVEFDCLVTTEDGVRSVAVVAEFSDKIASQDIAAGMPIMLVPEVINIESSIEGGTLKAVAVVDTAVLSVPGVDHICLTKPDDGIYAQTQSVAYSSASATETETVYLTDSAAAPKIAEVLYTVSRSVVTGAEAADGEIKVTGSVYSSVIVKTDDGLLSSVRIVTPFVKSVAALGAKDGDIAFATASVADTVAALIAGESRIELSATLTICTSALTARIADVVTDVFCADHEIETEKETVECMSVEPLVTVTDTVDGQIPIPADKPAADNVLCVGGAFCTLGSVKTDDRRIVAEGLVGGDIIYYNAEKNIVDTLAFRLPFSMPLQNATDAQDVTATCVVTDINVRVRRESVFDIKAEVAFTLQLSSTASHECVKSVTVGAELARPDATVMIHIAKPGETLWQAAKALCCSPDRVSEQNSAPAPYSGGERLINFCNK